MKQWKLCAPAPDDFLASRLDLSKIILQLLYNRGITDNLALDSFWRDILPADKVLDIAGTPDLRFYNPFLFRDMDSATDLIIEHIKNGHKTDKIKDNLDKVNYIDLRYGDKVFIGNK